MLLFFAIPGSLITMICWKYVLPSSLSTKRHCNYCFLPSRTSYLFRMDGSSDHGSPKATFVTKHAQYLGPRSISSARALLVPAGSYFGFDIISRP
jgi:hypothetical protein